MSTVNQSVEERRTYKSHGCEYLLNDEEMTAWIVKGPRIGRRRRYRVPETVNIEGVKYKVESIEIGAFGKAKCLKHLVIPDSIEIVDEYNFSSLPSLRSIYIGKGLNHLTSWIFQHNNKLRSFVISKENPHLYVEQNIVYTKDGKYAVTTPFKIKNLKIKEGVEAIESVAFWYNPNLKTISFPSTLKTIGDNSFAGCSSLKNLTLPEGFEKLTNQCFWACDHLETVELPSTLTEMEYETFYDCNNLRTIIIKNSQLLEPQTYRNCPVYLPEGCTLKVPKNLVEAYKTHPLWCNVTYIEPL